MRMVSSHQFFRIEDFEPTRMFTARLRSEIEDCEAKRTVSLYQFARAEDYETMRVVSSTYFRLPQEQPALNIWAAKN